MRGAIEGAERFIDQIAALLADKSTAHFPGDPHGPIVVADRDFGEVPMAEVFLSYSQMDRAAVERIAATLTSLGLSVWHDARLDSGDSFDAVIATELRDCKVVPACWSPDAIDSNWVRSEALFGYERRKLAALFLKPCELTPPFNVVHANDLANWTGEVAHIGWRGVVRGLARICGRPGVSALAEAAVEGSRESFKTWARHFQTSLWRRKCGRQLSRRFEQDFPAI
jgi:hypothetical protein